MILEHNLRHTITSQNLMREGRKLVYRKRKRALFNIAAWLNGFWEFLCGR